MRAACHFLLFSKNIINISKNDKKILIFGFLHVILPITAYVQEHAEFTPEVYHIYELE
ncbi:hypothetical protein CLOSYM_01576 [[Clostridium] symbiosum ATCC 14940]|uniref:Uncharacterized protein n=1 Tax=[Clostridium] symbiosum ATCC 14940 TaxID=411472 RepID=A0ABC9U041_CLOSY|nr:hypothetical protein CLOSYM_01576 [[Clostridium] symbiosum ATCC 14940]